MRLEVGRLYELDGRPWRCVLVNDCRARLVPTWKEHAELVDRDGNERSFEFTPRRALDVSPNALVPEWQT
jgi:hypothetical protein